MMLQVVIWRGLRARSLIADAADDLSKRDAPAENSHAAPASAVADIIVLYKTGLVGAAHHGVALMSARMTPTMSPANSAAHGRPSR
jgi:hypothetical protein